MTVINKNANVAKELDRLFNFCLRAKRKMLANNLEAAKNKCFWCEGTWHFVIAGSRKHLHAACDGTCGKRFME